MDNANSLFDLLKDYKVPEKKERKTERGELLKYFNENLRDKKGKRFGIPFLAMKLQGMQLPDLYHLKSVCDQESKRTFVDTLGQTVQVTFGMVFWKEIQP